MNSGIFIKTLLLIVLLVASLATIESHGQESSPATIGDAQVLRDLPYKHGDSLTEYERERCLLDVYLPPDRNGFATLVWFHVEGTYLLKTMVPEAFHSHLDKVAEFSRSSVSRILQFEMPLEMPQIHYVMHYCSRLFSHELYTLGKMDSLPPHPILPSGRPMNSDDFALSVVSVEQAHRK